MPRRRKTMTGADAQSIGSVPGQRYGEGVAQQEMQRAMPAPDGMGSDAPMPDVEPAVPSMDVGAPQVSAADPGALQEFLGGHNPRLLSGSSRPDEPVTAGLMQGPGPGPAMTGIASMPTPVRRTLMNLAEQTGNPRWREIAQRAGL
jgi:hypothetical protein